MEDVLSEYETRLQWLIMSPSQVFSLSKLFTSAVAK